MSTLVIDTIQGKTTAGSINVRGEGSNNTNLQQGLAKVWVHFTGTGTPAIDDSLNTSSITDTAQGRFAIVFNNDFSNANYAAAGMIGNNGNTTVGRSMHIDNTPQTNLLEIRTVGNDSGATGVTDDPNNMATFHGDLA